MDDQWVLVCYDVLVDWALTYLDDKTTSVDLVFELRGFGARH